MMYKENGTPDKVAKTYLVQITEPDQNGDKTINIIEQPAGMDSTWLRFSGIKADYLLKIFKILTD